MRTDYIEKLRDRCVWFLFYSITYMGRLYCSRIKVLNLYGENYELLSMCTESEGEL